MAEGSIHNYSFKNPICLKIVNYYYNLPHSGCISDGTMVDTARCLYLPFLLEVHYHLDNLLTDNIEVSVNLLTNNIEVSVNLLTNNIEVSVNLLTSNIKVGEH